MVRLRGGANRQTMENKWLNWATRLQSIAQAGLTYGKDRYDLERYEQIRALAVEIMHEHTEIPIEKLRHLFASETGYQTPKVDVRSVVFRNDGILMVREKEDGSWSLPGGWADVNTSVGESAAKECFEEAGATVAPKRILAVQHANRHNHLVFPYTVYKIFVECELKSMEFTENIETNGADFFDLSSLPKLSESRNTLQQIQMCFDAVKKDSFEAIFD
jgi:ADP-ribose pyrophosphatase YjhB (NUDIX family)